MRGNRYTRGGNPMLTRSERRAERARKVATSKRSIRLKKRLGRWAAKKFAHQEDSHTTALMESYILRRKEERRKERETVDGYAPKQDMTSSNNSTSCTTSSLHSVQQHDRQCQSSHSKHSTSSLRDDTASHVQGRDGRLARMYGGVKANTSDKSADRATSRRSVQRNTHLTTRSLY